MSSQQAFDLLGDRYEELKDRPGVDEDALAWACGDVRGYCEWHIAPCREATLAASGFGPGHRELVLPTLAPQQVTAVHLVTDTGEPGAPVLGWRPVSAGRLYRPAGWPAGTDNLLVELRHGYDECPDDLMAPIAERARAIASMPTPGVQIDQKVVGGVSRYRSFSKDGPAWSLAAKAVLERYRVGA